MAYNDPDVWREVSMTRGWMGIAIVALAGVLATASAAQDRALVVPGMKVLLNNDCVRVQYHAVGGGQSAPMHSHPAYVVYALQPFKAQITLSDGTQRISQHKAGEASLNPPISHPVKNLGKTP